VTSGGTHATDSQRLKVLVAEDDPINMKILRKRLERLGHGVHGTVNGEDCATVYREKSTEFDVVLMDMQVRDLNSVLLCSALYQLLINPQDAHR
jgi:CheY-like chemotaxis protein